MESDQNAEVLFHNTDQEFQFVDVENEIDESPSELRIMITFTQNNIHSIPHRTGTVPQEEYRNSSQQWPNGIVHD